MKRLRVTMGMLVAAAALAPMAAAQLRANPTGPAPLGTGAPSLMTPQPTTPGSPPLGAIGAPPTNAIGAPPLGAVGAPPVGAVGATPMGATAPLGSGMIGGTATNPAGPSQLATPGPPPSVDLNQFDNRLH